MGGRQPALTGTTLKVYRYLYKAGRPQTMHDVQRGLNLSSISVAQYHVKKLLEAGLVKQEEDGYVVDRIVFENTIRIRRSLIPFKVAYSVFFATMIGFLLIFLRPSNNFTDLFTYSLVVSVAALALFLYEAFRDSRKD
jgi:DNA-binding transcriptional ArsR family regulator